VYITVLVLMSMSSLIKQFSSRRMEILYGPEILGSASRYKKKTRNKSITAKKKKKMVTASKGKTCGHVVAENNDFFV